jgi:glycine hydroxymethyltransferase
MIAEVLDGLSGSNDGANASVEHGVGARVLDLCARFPIYPRK